MSELPDADAWVIIKRGLFFMPACQGYTGIRDHAGRYTREFAETYNDSSQCSIVRLVEAPEFMPAFNDLVIKHLIQQRDYARAEIEASRANMHKRDDFIVAKGLWSEFTGSLPSTDEASNPDEGLPTAEDVRGILAVPSTKREATP